MNMPRPSFLLSTKTALSRRAFLKGSAAAAGGAVWLGAPLLVADSETAPRSQLSRTDSADRSPKAGQSRPPLSKDQTFNESSELPDRLTGRATRRLTCLRQNNMQPTYHLNHCFSADSRYMVLATQHADGSSALLKAEVATGEMTVVATLAKDSGEQFTDAICMLQATNMVCANTGKALRAYHLDTLEETIVLNPVQGTSHPSGSIDGKKIFFPLHGERSYRGSGVVPVTHIEIDIATGRIRELFKEETANCHHVVECPTNPDLLLIDRDWPSKTAGPVKTRAWILNIKTRQLTELRPKDANPVSIHSNWSYRGEYVYYHGTSQKGQYPTSSTGHFIGVADVDGRVVWEGHFPTFFYGHTGSHTRGNIIITDGLFTPHLITAIHFEKLNSQGIPEIEILAQHNTNWAPGQNNHPHPHVSPDGRWLSYNRGTAVAAADVQSNPKPREVKDIYGKTVGFAPNRSDVYVVRL